MNVAELERIFQSVDPVRGDGESRQHPLPPITTGSLRVAHFIALHKPFVADFNVPIAVIDVFQNE
jgi:hypothetical protein